jgi:DNA-binding MarR family transcriptional regulator
VRQDQDGGDPAGAPSGRGAGSERDTAREESLADSFWAVARQLRETSQETLAPWDITPGHLRALRVLSRNGPIRLSMLSDKLHIAPRSATEVADALESRGLIERQHDPTDRRATLVQLTEPGQSMLAAIRAARSIEADRLFGRLSQADQADLASILGQLRK